MAVPTHNDVQFKIRIPADLKERVDAAAKANSRSTTAEIVATLEKEYPADAAEFEAAVAATLKDGKPRKAYLHGEALLLQVESTGSLTLSPIRPTPTDD